jgi:hypothetical protein
MCGWPSLRRKPPGRWAMAKGKWAAMQWPSLLRPLLLCGGPFTAGMLRVRRLAVSLPLHPCYPCHRLLLCAQPFRMPGHLSLQDLLLEISIPSLACKALQGSAGEAALCAC